MLVVIYMIIGLLLIVLQTTVFMLNPLWVASPDFYYILVAYLAYRLDLIRGLIIIFPLSWTLDVFSGVVLGTYPTICFGAFFLLKVMSAKIPVRESLYQIPLIGVSYLVISRIVHLGLSFFEPGAIAPWSWVDMGIRVALMVLFAFPLFRFFESIYKRFQRSFIPYKILRVRAGNRYRQEN